MPPSTGIIEFKYPVLSFLMNRMVLRTPVKRWFYGGSFLMNQLFEEFCCTFITQNYILVMLKMTVLYIDIIKF